VRADGIALAGVIQATGRSSELTLISAGDLVVHDVPSLPQGGSEIVAGTLTARAGGLIRIDSGAVLESATGKVSNVPPLLRIGELNPDQVLVPGDRVQQLTGVLGGTGRAGENLEQGKNFTLKVLWDDGLSTEIHGVNAGDRVVLHVGENGEGAAIITHTNGTGPVEVLLARQYPIVHLAAAGPTVGAQVALHNDEGIQLVDSRTSRGIDLNETSTRVSTRWTGAQAVTPAGAVKLAPPLVTEAAGWSGVGSAIPLAPPPNGSNQTQPAGTATQAISRIIRPSASGETESGGQRVAEFGRHWVIVKVGFDGKEDKPYSLPEGAVENLSALFEKLKQKGLPNGRYRIYLEESGLPPRKVIDFFKFGNSFGAPVREPPPQGSNPAPPAAETPNPPDREGGPGTEDDSASNRDPSNGRTPLVGAAALALSSLGTYSARGLWASRVDKALESSTEKSFTRAAQLQRRLRR